MSQINNLRLKLSLNFPSKQQFTLKLIICDILTYILQVYFLQHTYIAL